MARYEHCKPSLGTQKSSGSYGFIRQIIVNNFTFFMGPTDKLIAGSTEKRDGARYERAQFVLTEVRGQL
jgi:hypothetical protein